MIGLSMEASLRSRCAPTAAACSTNCSSIKVSSAASPTAAAIGLGKKRSQPAGQISTRNPERRPTKFCTIQFCKIDWLSAGREGPFSRVEIIDEGGSVLASGERGETRPSSGHHHEEIDAAKSLGQECNKVDGRRGSLRERA
jgi:hypothetical protein